MKDKIVSLIFDLIDNAFGNGVLEEEEVDAGNFVSRCRMHNRYANRLFR